MAKKVNKTDEQFANVEENLSKAGLYVEKNLLKIGIVTAIILVIIISFIYLKNNKAESLNKLQQDASSEMYIAEFYFQNNDYDKALNGDSILSIDNIGDTMISFHKGFIKISKEYSSTNVGNIANYYAAICQINLGEYENSLNSLNNFETDDQIISSLSTGLKGDAYMELGDTTKAMSFYKSAATDNVNSFTTPYFMMKQSKILELNKDFASALDIYNTIKSDYPESKEGINIDKYITSASNR